MKGYSVSVYGSRITGDWKIILISLSHVCIKIRFLKWVLAKVISYLDYLTASVILYMKRFKAGLYRNLESHNHMEKQSPTQYT